MLQSLQKPISIDHIALFDHLRDGMTNLINKVEIDDKLLYDSSENDNPGTIEIVFMPYFDDNELWLTYENRGVLDTLRVVSMIRKITTLCTRW